MEETGRKARDHGRFSESITLGPGSRLEGLSPVLEVLAAQAGARASFHLLGDLGELFEPRSPSGRLLLDSDTLPVVDIGLIERFLDRQPGWTLVLIGEDVGAGRRLLARAAVSWLPWPLDLHQLTALAAPAPAEARRPEPEPDVVLEPHPAPTPPPPEREVELVPEPPRQTARPPRDEPRTEMDEIDAILAGDEELEPLPAGDADEPAGPDEPAASEEATLASLEAPPTPRGLPDYYRRQIADLADIAQRLELSWTALSPEIGPEDEPGSQAEGHERDLARLIQFTKTLGYLVAAPVGNPVDLDLSTLVEEIVTGMRGQGEEAPRYMFRSGGRLEVHSDKALLHAALDALLILAQKCAGGGRLVRVETRPGAVESTNGTQPCAMVTIEFPSGPLEGLALDRVLEPYALRSLVPELGPNALSAAAGILRGQGGSLSLSARDSGNLVWSASVPRKAAEEDEEEPEG